jgi:calcium-dependent protein kinase
LLCGYPPFNGANENEIIERVRQGQFCTDDEDWEDISPAAKDLVHKLLTYDHKQRISA